MRFLFTFCLVFIFCVPFFTFASHNGGLVPCHGPECNACHLVQLGQNVLNFLVTITVLMSGVIFAIAGFKMVTSRGNSGTISEAREMFTNVIVGLVILLSAWLVVDTVMKVFVDESKLLGPWNEIQCVVQPISTTATPTPITPVTPVTSTPSVGALSHGEALAQLSGISVVSSGNCTDRNQRNCTSLDGLQSSALGEIKGTINSCTGCNLQITAGTEIGHKNSCHTSGTCVDIDCRGGCATSQINTVLSAASNSGARAVYEVSTQTRKAELVSAGVAANNIQVVGWITGEHFSLYTQ